MRYFKLKTTRPMKCRRCKKNMRIGSIVISLPNMGGFVCKPCYARKQAERKIILVE